MRRGRTPVPIFTNLYFLKTAPTPYNYPLIHLNIVKLQYFSHCVPYLYFSCHGAFPDDNNINVNLKEISNTQNPIDLELIVYGNTPVMKMNYCVLGVSNKCYPQCKMRCQTQNKYFLRDRLGFNFRILPDNIQTVTTIFNSKITSIYPKEFNIDYARIDILDETIEEINEIIHRVHNNQRFDGSNYTNGNLNKEI